MTSILITIIVILVLLLWYSNQKRQSAQFGQARYGNSDWSRSYDDYRPPDPPLTEQPKRDYIARRNPPGPVFAIRYRDYFGRTSERIISPIIVDSEISFRAYCYLRDDLREFRTDRILDCFDPDTGETFSDFDDACRKGLFVAERWKDQRNERREAGEKLSVFRR